MKANRRSIFLKIIIQEITEKNRRVKNNKWKTKSFFNKWVFCLNWYWINIYEISRKVLYLIFINKELKVDCKINLIDIIIFVKILNYSIL